MDLLKLVLSSGKHFLLAGRRPWRLNRKELDIYLLFSILDPARWLLKHAHTHIADILLVELGPDQRRLHVIFDFRFAWKPAQGWRQRTLNMLICVWCYGYIQRTQLQVSK